MMGGWAATAADLPDEVLERVFDWLASARELGRVGAVSTRWAEVARRERLWCALAQRQPWWAGGGRRVGGESRPALVVLPRQRQVYLP